MYVITPSEKLVWMRHDPGASGGDTSAYACSRCGRIECVPAHGAFPDGWSAVPGEDPTFYTPELLCPDCTRSFHQKSDGPAGNQEKLCIHPPEPKQSTVAEPFSIGIDREAGCTPRIAMMPEMVLMRCNPLGFFLTPPEARALASALRQAADKAERPPYLGGGEQ